VPRSRSSKVRVAFRFVVAIWAVLLIALSISPLSFKLRIHSQGAFHDFGHYTVYGATAILLWVMTKRTLSRFLAFAGGVGFAFGQEWIENVIYHAGFEWNDVRTDLAGLASGLFLVILVTTLMSDGRRSKPPERL
jgi:hypothetical protein